MADALRVECGVDGYTENWVEYDLTGWTLRNTLDLDAADGADLETMFDRMAQYMSACHLVPVEGEAITSPAAVTFDLLLDLDEVVVGWLQSTIYTAIGHRRVLGNVSARMSSASNGNRATTQKATT